MPNEYNEVNPVGSVSFNGCSPIKSDSISIEVEEAWDDVHDRQHILLTCNGGNEGVRYILDPEKAMALGYLLISASKSLSKMIETLKEMNEET